MGKINLMDQISQKYDRQDQRNKHTLKKYDISKYNDTHKKNVNTLLCPQKSIA